MTISTKTRDDPVCGMPVIEDTQFRCDVHGASYYFCSELCRQRFLAHPSAYIDAESAKGLHARGGDIAVAYFSMEIALESQIPTYSGGLGVLAGDSLRACADLHVPTVAVTLAHRKGYFHQNLDEHGNQTEQPESWDPSHFASRLEQVIEVTIGGRKVRVGAWRYTIEGATGGIVPVILLDTDRAENDDDDRRLTDYLYGGDPRYRLAQEVVLGIGGVRMLDALGFADIRRYRMNEGHSALLAIELLNQTGTNTSGDHEFDAVRRRCVFTTHTPVSAGHDRFPWALADEILGGQFDAGTLKMLGGSQELNMTLLALNMSHYVNGVAKRHAEVSNEMFPAYSIDAITNGIHVWTWASDSFRALYDKHIPGWRVDSATLRYSLGIPRAEVWAAHAAAKQMLIDSVNRTAGASMNTDTLTIGFARRATAYKRPALIFHDLNRLRETAERIGGIQLIFAGKAHPKDTAGKDLIRQIIEAGHSINGKIRVSYLPNYDMNMARLLVGGCDLWLNTPRKPMEASGTSGMKAAINGIPQLSVLDGWWLEGCVEGVTGWPIGTPDPQSGDDAADAAELYDKIGATIGRMFYQEHDRWIDVMRHAMAINGSFFNTHRMIQQYALNADLR